MTPLDHQYCQESDLFFYRDPDEIERAEQEAKEIADAKLQAQQAIADAEDKEERSTAESVTIKKDKIIKVRA